MSENWAQVHSISKNPCEAMAEYLEKRRLWSANATLAAALFVAFLTICLLSKQFSSNITALSGVLAGVGFILMIYSLRYYVTTEEPRICQLYAENLTAFMNAFTINTMEVFDEYPDKRLLQVYIDEVFQRLDVRSSSDRNTFLHKWAYAFGLARPWGEHIHHFGSVSDGDGGAHHAAHTPVHA